MRKKFARIALVSMATLIPLFPQGASAAESSSTHWNPTVVSAMTYIHDADPRLPMVAPSWTPQVGRGGYLVANVSSKNHEYNVTLVSAGAKLAVNDPRINQPPNSAMVNQIGDFGVSQYTAPVRAMRALASINAHMNANGASHVVNLGHGITARMVNGNVIWTEGQWHCAVYFGTAQEDITIARTLVSYVASHPLPTNTGKLSVFRGADGEHTTVDWVVGPTLYHSGNVHSAIEGVHMAESMRPYS